MLCYFTCCHLAFLIWLKWKTVQKMQNKHDEMITTKNWFQFCLCVRLPCVDVSMDIAAIAHASHKYNALQSFSYTRGKIYLQNNFLYTTDSNAHRLGETQTWRNNHVYFLPRKPHSAATQVNVGKIMIHDCKNTAACLGCKIVCLKSFTQYLHNHNFTIPILTLLALMSGHHLHPLSHKFSFVCLQ
jgi:hypothetical protein